ncbi:MAG: phosphate ABC transporter ATP-binding protein PstB [Actinobacteria bacterium]|nr:phosphate ABC transporter ATP-binding protein PstB [Actinomycetota bacterium]
MVEKIRVSELTLYYKDFKALEDISIIFYAKNITALIGPSGCGKTSLLRTLNKMTELIVGARVEGQILLDGIDINNGKQDLPFIRKNVGMIFQKPTPFPMSIYDNIRYGVAISRRTKKAEMDGIVEKSLRAAALWGEVKGKINQSALNLSGGQQQRLCIARALAVEPEVLLMDEPCASLDPISTMQIEDLMRELKKTLTIIIVTHNMQQAARVSDYSAFILAENAGEPGRLVEFGRTGDVFTNPLDKRTENYITGRFG